MKTGFLLIVFVLAGVACTTVVDFDIPLDKPKVVVNSLFSPDSVWRIQISRSNTILANSAGSYFLPVTDAIVLLLDQDNQLLETFTGFSDQFFTYSYSGKSKPMPGQTYHLRVSINDEPDIRVVNTVPTQVPIASIEIDSSGVMDGEPIKMHVSFKDPVMDKNYYTVKIIEDAVYFVNNDSVRLTQEIYFEVIDQSLGNDERGQEKLINDNRFNGKDYTFNLKLYRRYSYGVQASEQHTRVLLLNVSEEYYKYFSTKNLQDYTNGDPFAQPVQVFTNVENGLGIFAAYSSSVIELN